MHKDRLRIATALGYYARATITEPITPYSIAQAIEQDGFPEYRHDIDCQIAFRKGFQEAEEHLKASVMDTEDVGRLARAVEHLVEQVKHARNEIKSLHGRLGFNIAINQRAAHPMFDRHHEIIGGGGALPDVSGGGGTGGNGGECPHCRNGYYGLDICPVCKGSGGGGAAPKRDYTTGDTWIDPIK